jgi:hypothetical protein
MWWRTGKGDEDLVVRIVATRFRTKILRKDFATSCNLALRCCCRGKTRHS